MRQDQNKNLLSTQFYIMHWNWIINIKHRGWSGQVTEGGAIKCHKSKFPFGIIGIVFDE